MFGFESSDNTIKIMGEVYKELAEAEAKFEPFNSSHEGYAILLEEVDELWDVVKINPKKLEGGAKARNQMMRAEAIQVAAMAIRFVKCICDKETI